MMKIKKNDVLDRLGVEEGEGLEHVDDVGRGGEEEQHDEQDHVADPNLKKQTVHFVMFFTSLKCKLE